MISLEGWMDLVCASLPQGRAARSAGPVLVCHEAQRVWPLLEGTDSVIWVHARPRLLCDFSASPLRLPVPRDRLALDRDAEALGALQQRARLCIVVVPEDEATARRFAEFVGARQREGGEWLVMGPASRAGWRHFQPGAAPVRSVGPLQLQASPGVLQALEQWRLFATGLGLRTAQFLQGKLPARLGMHLDLTGSSALRMRLRPDPVNHTAGLSEAIGHHIRVENRALFNQRGVGALALPWDGRIQVRMLLRNVRDRIDDGVIAAGGRAMPMAHLDYTDKGALMTLQVPSMAPGADALVHITLPRPAVPSDGFCDIGATEFLVDLA